MNQTATLIKKTQSLNHRIEEIEQMEETMWFQRSRQNWLTDEDRNSVFFHEKASQRSRANRLQQIQNSLGQWIEDD